jgi:SAM-dependent methyltransferase
MRAADNESSLIELISPVDEMLGAESRERYFAVGRSALRCIRTALSAARRPDPQRILDLPSGHGRVLRHLRAAFPAAEITACDSSIDAIEFCASTFAAVPVGSTPDLRQLSLPGRYDLIWCGSLFTHLGERDWGALIDLFHATLSTTGVLVVSTHGRLPAHYLKSGARNYGLDRGSVARLLSEYERSGFAHVPYDPAGTYGLSLSRPSWVVSYLERWPDLRLVAFTECGWDDHHDIICCTRSEIE